MNLYSFSYFIVLERERSFTRAAQALHITQQSLSTHISQLEKEIGTPLIIRHTPLELTFAGEAFLRHAKIMEHELAELQHEMSDITEQHRGILRIGVGFTRSHAIMPPIIEAFQKEYPNIEIVLRESTNRRIRIALENKEIDLAIARFEKKSRGIRTDLFYREKIYLILSSELLSALNIDREELVRQLRIGNLRAMKDCPFVMCSPDDIVGRMERDLLEKAGIRPIVKASSDNIETLLSLCNRSVGACLCPDRLFEVAFSEEEYQQLEVFSLGEEADYPMEFGWGEDSYQWKVITEFIRIARNALPDSGDKR